MHDFRVDIGRADKGRTFVRVVHLPTGNERSVIGLGDSDAKTVASRLIEELQSEVSAAAASASQLPTKSGTGSFPDV